MKALTPQTKGIWIETPSNPLLNLVNIEEITAIAREANCITVADNTFMSPYLQRPLDLGVDVVIHSTTKYLNGHSDVVGGCVIAKTKEHAERVKYIGNALGLGCSPFDAWLVLRGVKTLAPRMERISAVRWLWRECSPSTPTSIASTTRDSRRIRIMNWRSDNSEASEPC